MKKKETLDFLKGPAMNGIINDANAATAKTNPVEKVAAKVQTPPGPSVIPPVIKYAAKKTAVKQADCFT